MLTRKQRLLLQIHLKRALSRHVAVAEAVTTTAGRRTTGRTGALPAGRGRTAAGEEEGAAGVRMGDAPADSAHTLRHNSYRSWRQRSSGTATLTWRREKRSLHGQV